MISIHEKIFTNYMHKIQGNKKTDKKFTFSVLNLCQNKQNVNLALGIFQETTIATCKSLFPERENMI